MPRRKTFTRLQLEISNIVGDFWLCTASPSGIKMGLQLTRRYVIPGVLRIGLGKVAMVEEAGDLVSAGVLAERLTHRRARKRSRRVPKVLIAIPRSSSTKLVPRERRDRRFKVKSLFVDSGEDKPYSEQKAASAYGKRLSRRSARRRFAGKGYDPTFVENIIAAERVLVAPPLFVRGAVARRDYSVDEFRQTITQRTFGISAGRGRGNEVIPPTDREIEDLARRRALRVGYELSFKPAGL